MVAGAPRDSSYRRGVPWKLHDPASRAGGLLLSAPLFVVVNAVVFVLLRPGVPDLWAARARASAAADGVGLTYWFGWFGGSTPGGYSVLAPYLCAWAGTEVVAAVCAVAIGGLAPLLLGDTRRPVAASWMAAVGVVVNLWCGRVPFLLGTACAVGAVLFVRRRRRIPAGLLAVLTALASPVAGAFLGLALSGVLLAPATRAYRATALSATACAFGALAAIALAFGAPGPEPFPAYLLAEVGVALLLMSLATPRGGHLRITLVVSGVAALVVFSVPNGLGANFVRLALFWLPAVAVASSPVRSRVVVLLMAPILVFAGLTSVSAAQSASRPASHAAYYAALAAKLDSLPDVGNHRLELVNVPHAAYAALLGHAPLARGWETQRDRALNAELHDGSLGSLEYRSWLKANAVGYVAIDGIGRSDEARLVLGGRLPDLREVWREDSWRLYQVLDATPIVDSPAILTSATQAAISVHVPCACRTLVRVRWSRFLTASPPSADDADAPTLAASAAGWTTLTTDRPGTYVLRGVF